MILLTYLLTYLPQRAHGNVDDGDCADSMGVLRGWKQIPRSPTKMKTNVEGLPRGCERNAEMKMHLTVTQLLPCQKIRQHHVSNPSLAVIKIIPHLWFYTTISDPHSLNVDRHL